MSEYTKGPWVYHWNVKSVPAETFILSDDGHVCTVYGGYDKPSEANMANANLISAAPDLFEALDKMLDHFEGNIPLFLFELAEGAISKAKGDAK
jgi:hypothetical protein